MLQECNQLLLLFRRKKVRKNELKFDFLFIDFVE